MPQIKQYKHAAKKRSVRIRTALKTSGGRYRLAVYKSNKYIYGQIIDPQTGKTLTGVRGVKAEEVGLKIAKQATEKKATKVVFDRGSWQYHGKIKELAEAARKGGLKF